MTFSKIGEALLNKFEGFVPHPYPDVKGVPTIGYGTTHYPDGTKVSLTDPAITQDKAIEYRDFFINHWVIPIITSYVKVPLTQDQIDSLICFIYNVGPGAFETSHLLAQINASAPCDQIRDEFYKWRKSGGKVINALVKRRRVEAALFC